MLIALFVYLFWCTFRIKFSEWHKVVSVVEKGINLSFELFIHFVKPYQQNRNVHSKKISKHNMLLSTQPILLLLVEKESTILSW